MVYYYTCSNMKMLNNILTNYENATQMSPCEYMKLYIENFDESRDDSKLCWIVETFLGIKKHEIFLNKIIVHVPFNLNEEDRKYLMIILHGIIFQICSSNTAVLYKNLFNLNKPLLNALTSSLISDDFLSHISQTAQTIYDTNYITEKVIGPLLIWQPLMNKMAEMYSEYLNKVQIAKIKQPTIPIQLNVLERKSKKDEVVNLQKISVPATPPNSIFDKPRRMLTKTSIDKKLKQAHDNNKQKAMKLLNDVKSESYHYAPKETDRTLKKCFSLQDGTEHRWNEAFQKSNHGNRRQSLKPVKETIATLKRFNERIKISEQEEVQWLQDLVNDCKNTNIIQQLEAYDREERERERLLDVEKKHLLGQISFEEAVLAKKMVQEENKRKYQELVKQKELWNKEIEKLNMEKIEVNRKIFEKLSLLELNVIEARKQTTYKKKEEADLIRKESEVLLLKALKNKHEELERKIQVIKEIKILSIIAKRAKIPKIIDLTETSGLGLLCEMSIAELQERLSSMRITLKEELEVKNKLIKQKNLATKKALDETRKYISDYLDERKNLREKNVKQKKITKNITSEEINNLKIILKAKRELRLRVRKNSL